MMSSILYREGVYLLSAILLLLTGMFTPAFVSGATANGVLDGKTFVVEQGEKGEKAEYTDTLIFKDGRFRSTGCDQYGFGDGAYTTKVDGDTIQFVADTMSEKKGKMHWEGTIKGGMIDVSYVWTDRAHWYKPFPGPREYWAKGELQK